MSCRRLTCTARDGSRITSRRIHPITGMKDSPNPRSTNHQYSDRDALPLKSMYLLKHVLIDSEKVKTLALLWIWAATLKHGAALTPTE